MQEIPIIVSEAQTFNTTLDGVVYQFDLQFNTRAQYWTMTIRSGGVDVVNGAVIVGGVNLLNQYPFDLDNVYALNIADPKLDATSENLGTDVKLFKLTEAEVLSLG